MTERNTGADSTAQPIARDPEPRTVHDVAEPALAPMSRAATAADAIAGVQPRAVVAPASLAEAAEVMREGGVLGFVGGGTALALGAPPAALDTVLRTERMARILEYAPADMVIVVEAGVTLAAIQDAARAHGQRLALDAPEPARATVGGLIAVGAAGPLRMRYGTIRDLIIGVTLIRADGEIARGGGKVVKNVAGFDLPKVACGSLGTLGFVAGAAFRLHPLPEASETVRVEDLSAERVVAIMAAARDAQLEPAAAIAYGEHGRFTLAVRFEGFGRGVADQRARFAQLAPAIADDTVWPRHDALRTAAPRVRIAALPTQLPEVARWFPTLAWYPTVGVGFAPVSSDLAAARATLSVVVEAGASADPWGPVPPGFAIMQRLKHRFDPNHRLNPGRFVGGL